MSSNPSQWRISRPTSPDGHSLIPSWDDKVEANFKRDKIVHPEGRRFLEALIAFFEDNGYGGTLKTPFGEITVKPRCKRGDA